jgi:Cu+-exporting ATPase
MGSMPDTVTLAPSLSLPVTGMTCASCAGRVERALRKVSGVEEVSVNLATEQAQLRGTAPLTALSAAIEGAGYAVAESARDIGVTGMTCASCAGRVQRALEKVPGVFSASVNLATEQAHLRLLPTVETAALAAALEKAGYALAALAEDAAPDTAPDRRAEIELGIAFLLAAPFLAGMLGMAFGRDWMPPGWAQLLLAAPLQFWLGAR